MPSSRGVVTISLDTELAWGCFDTVGVSAHELAYRQTRGIIDNLCKLFEEYNISATWALVAHLLDDCRSTTDAHSNMIDPEFEWVDRWSESLPCRSGVSKDLWYAPDILETIRRCATEQEVGLHGYSHMVLSEEDCRPSAARQEISKAVAVAEDAGLRPESFVFPRNKIGYRSILSDHGISVYRSRDSNWYERPRVSEAVKKGCRYGSELFTTTPPIVKPSKVDDLVAIPGSQTFRPYHGGWQFTPANSQRTRARKGIDAAAETGDIFHLWFHPFNLALEPDRLLKALEDVLQYVADQQDQGQIDVLTMGEIGTQFQDGRWNESE